MRIVGKWYWVVACLILSAGVARAETLDRIVAVVNGDIILYSELQNRVQLMEKESPEMKVEGAEAKAKIDREVLQLLIRERLTEQEVARLKITVSQSELDATIKGIKQDNNFNDAQFEYVVRQEGLTIDKFRDRIKKQLERTRLVDRVLKSKTVITEQQVDAYIKSGSAEGKGAKKIAIIFLPTPDGPESKEGVQAEKLSRDLHSRLKDGADFAKLAREYSKGPAAAEGGDIGFIDSDDLAPPIAAATRNLKPNEITDPVKTGGGYYIIKVLELQKSSPGGAGDSVAREKARKQLFQAEVNRKFEEWLKDLESKAFIEILL